MKRIIIGIFLLISIFVESNNAQIIKSYGLKLGVCNSEQVWNSTVGLDYSYNSAIWGYNFGVYVEYFDLPYLSITSEVNYIQKGRTITVYGVVIDYNSPNGYRDIGPVKTKHRFDYLSIPIQVKFRYDNAFVIPYISVGPSIDFLISHPESDLYSKFNKTELGIKASAGINVPYGILSRLNIEFSYYNGITNMYKNENVKIYNRGYSLLIGIAI